MLSERTADPTVREDDSPSGTATTEFRARRPRGAHRPETTSEARRALRTEIRRGRRPGDRSASAGPPRYSVSATYLRAQRQAARRRAARRRRRFLLLLVLLTALLVVVDLVRGNDTEPERAQPSATASPQPPAVANPGANPSGEAIQPEATPSSPTAVSVPQRGSGTFTVASGTSKVRGTAGTLVRYQVRVENGSGQGANTFAEAVDTTLADPRGWTAAKKWRFQRVTGGEVDAVILLATPETTNKICRAGGLDPGGYTSCRTGDQVVINLARWLLAVPAFNGDLATYRQYVVNHEMGHQLGHGHVLCGGPGRPAPVMQQQTLGLQSCVPNAWPFVNGKYLTGAPTAGQ